MAISKELYERYKAMKAAKLAQEEGSKSEFTNNSPITETERSNLNSETHSKSYSSFTQPEKENSNWTTSYSTPDDYSQSASTRNNYTNTKQEYNSQFAFSHPQEATVQTQISQPTEQSQPKIKKFALIGYPLGHSLSEYIHSAGFKSLGIKATYELIPTPPEELVDRVKYLRNNGYSGFNVTIPLKLPVTMFLDEVDSSANIVKAINTVMIEPQTNALKGYNTDVTGFIKAIPEEVTLYNKTIAILGTGGAARAAITALAQKQVKEIKLFTRNIANCIELLEYLRKSFPKVAFNAYQIDKFKDLSKIDMVVNATPIGMSGQAVGYSPLEEEEILTLPSQAIVYDVIYNPKKTNLIKLAQKHNLKTITGLDMLIYQAQESQKIWTGLTPDFKDMKIAGLENLD